MPQLSPAALEQLKQAKQSITDAFSPPEPTVDSAPYSGPDPDSPEAAKATALRMMQIKQKLDAIHASEDAETAKNGPALSANPQAAALAAQSPDVLSSDSQPGNSNTFQSDIDAVKRAYLLKLAAGGGQ